MRNKSTNYVEPSIIMDPQGKDVRPDALVPAFMVAVAVMYNAVLNQNAAGNVNFVGNANVTSTSNVNYNG